MADQIYTTDDPIYFNDEEKVTEADLNAMGFATGGKLLVAKDDKDVFVLLTSDGRAIPLRVD